MTKREPREFWILANEILQWKVFSKQVKTQLPNDTEVIHVREVLSDEDQADIIPDLIHQRSIAWDDARKYRLLAEELVQALEQVYNPNAPKSHIVKKAMDQYREATK